MHSSSQVWMWELDYKESWGLKYWCFELWCWRRLLRVPLTARRSNQSILKEISHDYSLEGLMLKQKLQYFGHLMPRADSLGKTLMLGRIEGRRRRWRQRVRWLNGITDSMDMGLGGLLELVDREGGLACCGRWVCKDSDTTERLNYTELSQHHLCIFIFIAFWYYFYLNPSNFLFPSTYYITSVNLMWNLRFIILLLVYYIHIKWIFATFV